MRKIIGILLVCLALATPAYAATDWYVSTGGVNSYGLPNGDIDHPFLTLQFAASNPALNCGDTINLRTGSYDGGAGLTYLLVTMCASWGSSITVRAYTPDGGNTWETVTMTAPGSQCVIGLSAGTYPAPTQNLYWTFEHLTFDLAGSDDADGSVFCGGALSFLRFQDNVVKNTPASGIFTSNNNELYDVDGWEIRRNHFVHNGWNAAGQAQRQHAIYLTHVVNPVIEDNLIEDSGGYGCQLNSVSGTIRRNVIHDNGLSHDPQAPTPLIGNGNGGCNFGNGANNTFYNNVVYHNGAAGIQINSACVDCTAYNNTSWNNGTGIFVWNSTRAIVRGNISFQNYYSDLTQTSSIGETITGNFFTTSGPLGSYPSNDYCMMSECDGMSTAFAAHDFVPPAMSPVLDNGPDLSAAFTTDILGNTRDPGHWDQGAYQVTNVSTCTPTHLVFGLQPGSVQIGGSLGTVTAIFKDASEITCTNITSNVTFAKHVDATWNSLQFTSGTGVKAAVGGVATITTMFVSPTPGTGSIKATSSMMTDGVSNPITITAASHDCQGHTFYIDYTGGVDTNDGCSKLTPWKHAPNMNGVTAGVGPAYYGDPIGGGGICNNMPCDLSGYSFIFKGGVTWPHTVSDSGYDCGICIGTYGTNMTRGDGAVYYGVDQTWYTGASWTRPIFDSGGSAAGPQCHATMAVVGATSYVIFDNIKFTGLYWDATCQGNYLSSTAGQIHLVSPGLWCADACGSNTFYVKVLKNSGGTDFVNGVSTASFGTGVTVNTFTVINGNSAFANITVTGSAGYRDVSVTTGGTTITATNGFRKVDVHIAATSAVYLGLGGNGNIEAKNIHATDWSHGAAADGTLDEGVCNLFSGNGTNTSLHHTIMDGESSKTATEGTGYRTETTWNTGGFDTSCSGAIYPGPPIQHDNYYAWLVNGSLSGNKAFYNNTCHHIGGSFAGAIDPLVVSLNTALSISLPTYYQDVHDQCYEDLNSSEDSVFANNLIHDVEAGVLVWIAPISPATAYIYNNVIYGNGANSSIICSTQDFGVTPTGPCDFRNNTLEGEQAQISGGATSTNVFKNNHFIGGASSIAGCGVRCTQDHNTLDADIATAEADGYYAGSPSQYPYSPTSSGDTVAAGASLTTFCAAVLAADSSWPDPCITSTVGVTYDPTALVISSVALDTVTRNATPDAGAYQFNSSAPEITGVSPDEGEQGTMVLVTVTGQGTSWTADSYPDIENTGDMAIPYWIPIDSSHIQFPLFVASNATVGMRYIVVYDGLGGQLTLANAFEVTAGDIIEPPPPTDPDNGVGRPRVRLRIR